MNKETLEIYANDLYKKITKNIGEKYTPKDFVSLLLWLDEHNIVIDIDPEFYSNEIRWIWVINFCVNFIDEYSTRSFGIDGERSMALSTSVTRALELFLLKTIDCKEFFNEDELLDCKIDPDINTSLFDLYKFNEYESRCSIDGIELDEEWDKFNRKTAIEFVNYIKERILKLWKK